MRSTTERAGAMLAILSRLDTYLRHVTSRHAAGLSWDGLVLPLSRIIGSTAEGLGPAEGVPDPLDELPSPLVGCRQTMRRDVHGVRRLLGSLAAQLRFAAERCPLTIALADGLLVARSATTMRDMRDRLLDETLVRLRRVRRDVMRRTDAVGSVDIRLDTWGAVGDLRRAGVRAYLDGVLQQQADYANYTRGSLGRLVELRTALDVSCERVEALIDGVGAVRPRTDSGPLVLSMVTPPEPRRPAVSAARPPPA